MANISNIDELMQVAYSDRIQKIVVGAVIIRMDQEEPRFLALRRSAEDFMGGLLELPSGTVDSGEKLLGALAREIEEETGISEFEVHSYVGSFDYLSGSGKKTRQLTFLVVTRESAVSLNPAEHSEYAWITPLQAAATNMSKETMIVVEKAYHALDGYRWN